MGDQRCVAVKISRARARYHERADAESRGARLHEPLRLKANIWGSYWQRERYTDEEGEEKKRDVSVASSRILLISRWQNF